MAKNVVNVTTVLDHRYAATVLTRIAEVVEDINDPEQIKGIIAVIRDGLIEMAKNDVPEP